MEIKQSKIVKGWKHEEPSVELVSNSNANQDSDPSVELVANSNEIRDSEPCTENAISSFDRRRYFDKCVALYKAAMTGDWEAAEKLIKEDETLVRDRITTGKETALHTAAAAGHVHFVDKLLGMLDASDLAILNTNGCTALCFAAAAGHIDIVRLMLNQNLPGLPNFRGENGLTPLYMAVLQGYTQVAEILFPLSDFKSWIGKDRIELLTTSIKSGLYGLAVKIVNENKKLAVTEDDNRQKPLEVLATKPSAFCGTSRRDAYALFDCLWNIVISEEDVEAQAPGSSLSKLLFLAAESGNYDFLTKLIERDPNLICERNHLGHSIFHIAVLHRHVKVFNLIYEHYIAKVFILSAIDTDKNNILHLAARLSPQVQLDRIPGATLQMQQDVLWYKVVEKMVPLSYRFKINSKGQTPHDLFLTAHKNLMKEAENQMKQIAKSCMLVTILVATVVFTTTFTVPGGYNNKGAPVLQDKKFFIAFPISEAVAIVASLTSMLMLLLVLTSRYSANDFLRWLPFWLVVGVATLLFSIMALMVAFCTSLLFYKHGVAIVYVILVVVAILLIMFFIMKCHLFITLLRCTYGFRSLFRFGNGLRL